MPLDPDRHISPVDAARLLGVRDSKVVGWIRNGELKASNLAAVAGRRPRWKISPEALEAFLAMRAAVPAAKPVRRRKRDAEVIEFFK